VVKGWKFENRMGVLHSFKSVLKRLFSHGWAGIYLMGLGCLCTQPAVAQAPGLTPPGVADWVNAVLTSHPLVRARREEALAILANA
jgi:hypothetical protein